MNIYEIMNIRVYADKLMVTALLRSSKILGVTDGNSGVVEELFRFEH